MAGPVHTLNAPAHWRCIDFASDIHLCADKPRTAEAFFRYLRQTPAQAVCLLGDLFEVWIGDDAISQPGFAANCARQLREVAKGRDLFFLAGNRDFLIGDVALAACGMTGLSDPTLLRAWGQQVLLTHGDAWCTEDLPYQAFRTQVRQTAWQQAFLAKPLAERERLARQIRNASEERKSTSEPDSYVDIDGDLAESQLSAAGSRVLIHGHTHRPQTGSLPQGSTRHVLADWEMDERPTRGDILRWTPSDISRIRVSDTTSASSASS